MSTEPTDTTAAHSIAGPPQTGDDLQLKKDGHVETTGESKEGGDKTIFDDVGGFNVKVGLLFRSSRSYSEVGRRSADVSCCKLVNHVAPPLLPMDPLLFLPSRQERPQDPFYRRGSCRPSFRMDGRHEKGREIRQRGGILGITQQHRTPLESRE